MSFYILLIRCQALTHNACKYYKKIVKSYKKIIKYSQAFMIFVILLFSFITFKLSEMIFNPLSIMTFIYFIIFSFFAISYEKITIKENYIVLEAIRNNKSICYSQKIFLDEINKIYFKSSFWGGRLDLLTYSIVTFDRYLKIETTEPLTTNTLRVLESQGS